MSRCGSIPVSGEVQKDLSIKKLYIELDSKATFSPNGLSITYGSMLITSD